MSKQPNQTPKTAKALAAETKRVKAENALKVERIMSRVISATARKARPGMLGGGLGGIARGRDRSTRVVSLSDYSQAIRGKTRPGYGGNGGSAQQHLDWRTHDRMRRDCQKAFRTMPVLRALVNRHTDLMVGDGPVVTSESTEADELFEAWSEGLRPDLGHPDLKGMLTLSMMCRTINEAWDVDGDILPNFTSDDDGRGCVELIESERIVGPSQLDSASIKAGVEIDGRGRPVRFWIGSWDSWGRLMIAPADDQNTLEAESCAWLPNPIGLRVGQYRGEPRVSALIPMIEILSDYIESTAIASYVASCLGLVFTSERPADLQAAMTAATETRLAAGEADEEPPVAALSPGWVMHNKNGEKVEQIKPEQPAQNFKDFVHTLCQIGGADLGVPLAIALYEAGQLNFSNLRGVMALAERGVQPGQCVLANQFVKRLRRMKVTEWQQLGILARTIDPAKCDVQFPRAPVIDFKTEVEGYALAEDRNYMTHEQVCLLIGSGRSRDIKQKREKERREDEKRNIAPPDMPGAKRPGDANTPAKEAATQ